MIIFSNLNNVPSFNNVYLKRVFLFVFFSVYFKLFTNLKELNGDLHQLFNKYIFKSNKEGI